MPRIRAGTHQNKIWRTKIKYADVAELADAPDLGSGADGVQVRVLSSAPCKNRWELPICFCIGVVYIRLWNLCVQCLFVILIIFFDINNDISRNLFVAVEDGFAFERQGEGFAEVVTWSFCGDDFLGFADAVADRVFVHEE